MDPSLPEHDVEAPISLPMSQWHTIDGTVDNAVSSATVEPDFEVVRAMGMIIREAGWDQVARRSSNVPGSGLWPPDDEIVTVRLTHAQWSWVASVLEHWATVAERLPGSEAGARDRREVRDLVLSRLTR